MSDLDIRLALNYSGNQADLHALDFYDVAQALLGFQRSLAIVTHLVLNNQVITQAPALKGATILVSPPRDGSWEIVAAIVAGAGYVFTRPKDTPLGHLVHSAYDYVVRSALGFDVDYSKTLGVHYRELSRKLSVPILDENRFDSAIEKCENAIKDMHRPIIKSKTARSARIGEPNFDFPELDLVLDIDTYGYLAETNTSDVKERITGRISSYNINTFRGRIYTNDWNRPIPFILDEGYRLNEYVSLLTKSLMINSTEPFDDEGNVTVEAYRNMSPSGRLKSFQVVSVGK